MKLIEVKTAEQRKEFLQLPIRLYRNDEHWIRPLDKDVEDVFDPEVNQLLHTGSECCRWVLRDEHDKTVGRVAAFVNKDTAYLNEQPTGGMGFYECIDNQEAADKLLKQCSDWLNERGMEAMDGPINFGERDRWWGLLADGFDKDPTYCMPYTKPYYISQFEAYGFKEYFKQFTFGRKVQEPVPRLIQLKAERVNRTGEYTYRHFEKAKSAAYTEDFRQIYNAAWVGHGGVNQMTTEQSLALMKKMKPVIDEKVILFAYHNDKPVAFFVMLPELNEIFKHVNGKLDLIGKLKFLYHQWRKTCNSIFGVIFGVIPEHQGKGVEAGLIMFAARMTQGEGARYENFQMNWIGDFNPAMIRVAEGIGGQVVKTHLTMRYLFDRNKPFHRAENVS